VARATQQATVYTGHGGLFHDPHDKAFKLFSTAAVLVDAGQLRQAASMPGLSPK